MRKYKSTGIKKQVFYTRGLYPAIENAQVQIDRYKKTGYGSRINGFIRGVYTGTVENALRPRVSHCRSQSVRAADAIEMPIHT